MKRFTMLALSFVLAAYALPVVAHEGHVASKKATKTVTGEVVDMGCYLGHTGRGENHVSCATKCVNNGMPMGLLTKNGTLYLLTLDHDNADPYNSLKGMVGKTVDVTGEALTRSGLKAIDVTAAKLAS